jgi:hypothetical protein
MAETKTSTTAKQAESQTAAEEAPAGKRVIATYKSGGINVRRVLTAANWKDMGVEGQGQMVWEKKNNWMVDVTEAHPIVRKYLEKDAMFTVEEL